MQVRIWVKNYNNLILYVLELIFNFLFSVLVCIIMILLRIGLISLKWNLCHGLAKNH
jgi:hypothetical protein